MTEIDKILHLLNYADAIYSKATFTPEESKQLIDYINAQKAEIEKLKADLIVWKQDRFNLYQRLELYNTAREKVAREIFEDIWSSIATHAFTAKSEDYADGAYDTIEWVDSKIAEVEKKYTEGESNG